MAIPEANVQWIVRLLLADINATLGSDHDWIVRSNARRLLEFCPENWLHRQELVDDVQQQIHDEFIDTSWPACPLHRRHPLWFKDDGWWCEQDDVMVAKLGELRG